MLPNQSILKLELEGDDPEFKLKSEFGCCMLIESDEDN